MIILVNYTCRACGLTNVEVVVRARGPAEAVGSYVRHVVPPLCVADHDRRSPRCRPQKFDRLWIPTGPDHLVGRPNLH